MIVIRFNTLDNTRNKLEAILLNRGYNNLLIIIRKFLLNRNNYYYILGLKRC